MCAPIWELRDGGEGVRDVGESWQMCLGSLDVFIPKPGSLGYAFSTRFSSFNLEATFWRHLTFLPERQIMIIANVQRASPQQTALSLQYKSHIKKNTHTHTPRVFG